MKAGGEFGGGEKGVVPARADLDRDGDRDGADNAGDDFLGLDGIF